MVNAVATYVEGKRLACHRNASNRRIVSEAPYGHALGRLGAGAWRIYLDTLAEGVGLVAQGIRRGCPQALKRSSA